MHELPTTGANRRTLKLISLIARYQQAFKERIGRCPPKVSLNSRQWAILRAQAKAHGLSLEDCTIGGVLLVNPESVEGTQPSLAVPGEKPPRDVLGGSYRNGGN